RVFMNNSAELANCMGDNRSTPRKESVKNVASDRERSCGVAALARLCPKSRGSAVGSRAGSTVRRGGAVRGRAAGFLAFHAAPGRLAGAPTIPRRPHFGAPSVLAADCADPRHLVLLP